MDTLDIFGLFAFGISLFAINIICSMLKNSITKQPTGNLSLLFWIINDISLGIQAHGSIQCVLAFVSRFSQVRQYLKLNSNLSMVVIGIADLTNTSTLFYAATICIVRLLCLKFVSFMEETVGEKNTRLCMSSVSLIFGLGCVTVLIVSKDIFSGAMYSVVTGQGLLDQPQIGN